MSSLNLIGQIEQSIRLDRKTKVMFSNRTPMYGKFIKADDYEDLKSKGMVRFVTSSRLEEWDGTGDITCSRIFVIKSFLMINILASELEVNLQ